MDVEAVNAGALHGVALLTAKECVPPPIWMQVAVHIHHGGAALRQQLRLLREGQGSRGLRELGVVEAVQSITLCEVPVTRPHGGEACTQASRMAGRQHLRKVRLATRHVTRGQIGTQQVKAVATPKNSKRAEPAMQPLHTTGQGHVQALHRKLLLLKKRGADEDCHTRVRLVWPGPVGRPLPRRIRLAKGSQVCLQP